MLSSFDYLILTILTFTDEDSSLILLADVALENPNTRSNLYRKRRRPRMVNKCCIDRFQFI